MHSFSVQILVLGDFMTLLHGGCRRCDNYQKGLCSGVPALLAWHSTYARGFLPFLAFLIPCHPGAEGASWTLDGSHCQCHQAQCLLKVTPSGWLYQNPSKTASSQKRPSMASHIQLVVLPTISLIFWLWAFNSQAISPAFYLQFLKQHLPTVLPMISDAVGNYKITRTYYVT